MGDDVIQQVAELCAQVLPEQAIFGRLGGEEFAALLPSTSPAMVQATAERMRQQIAQTYFSGVSEQRTVTISIGLAIVHPHESMKTALKQADLALYRAKSMGRNRVEMSVTS